ncbi:hypothetical protein NP493_1839g00001 [Ridgeia piscesae]|uniref:Fibrinogen C-terminal domain-containing protein n=1 Tax=Ridgeia piscesae TaxID=27915 RepID=A0AAD9JS71_RIDPI|nr:hypothetical protein NP493_1839g00001 [Ridgeia piscesae]
MCTSVCPVSLLAVVVVAFVVHPAPVVCQCTTGHCHDDGDNDVSVLTAMVSRLQDTVEQLQQQLSDSKAEQQQQLRDATEKLQQQLRNATEQSQLQRQLHDASEQLQQKLQQQLSDSKEQLQQQLRDATEQQQNQMTKLSDTLEKQEQLSKRWFAPRDCYDLLRDGHNVSGVYEVYLAKARKFVRVFCDMDSNDGGWLVFQRRRDGSVDFYRDWASYKEGFGDVEGEFWLGNDYLNDITSQARYVLRIDMEDFENKTKYEDYCNFAVDSERNKYKLSFGTHSGTAGDSLKLHANHPFSTKDRDNDDGSEHCAQVNKGAWWYTQCHQSNLNGEYLSRPPSVGSTGAAARRWLAARHGSVRAPMSEPYSTTCTCA